MKAVGCVGMLSNGPSRDVDAIRQLKFQMLLGGVTAGHGEMAVQAVNVPVSVGGMDVAPGEIIHMDENGAVKFPAASRGGAEERQGDARRRGAPPGPPPRGEDARPRCGPPTPAAPTRRRSRSSALRRAERP